MAELIDQGAQVAVQRAPVATKQVSDLTLNLVEALPFGKQLDDRHDQRRVADDAGLAVDAPRPRRFDCRASSLITLPNFGSGVTNGHDENELCLSCPSRIIAISSSSVI